MLGALSAALVSLDQHCSQVAALLHGNEPQVYGSVFVGVVFWVLLFPPRNDGDGA